MKLIFNMRKGVFVVIGLGLALMIAGCVQSVKVDIDDLLSSPQSYQKKEVCTEGIYASGFEVSGLGAATYQEGDAVYLTEPAIWIHYKEPDTLGHWIGENSAEYSQSIVIDDQALGRLIGELRAQGIEDRTLLIVTTDHGFNEGGSHHDTCTIGAKHLFLATSRNGTGLFGCIHSQSDIAPCIKRSF